MAETKKLRDCARAERIEAVKAALPFRRWDILVYGILAAFIGVVFWAVFRQNTPVDSSGKIVIAVNGETVKVVRAGDSGEFEIRAKDGAHLLTVRLADHMVTVAESSCGDHLCERMKISSLREQIVCLPNKIVIRATSRTMEPDITMSGFLAWGVGL